MRRPPSLRDDTSSDGDLEALLAEDSELRRALAVSQRVGRLLLKAEAGELALVDQLAQELLAGRDRRAPATRLRCVQAYEAQTVQGAQVRPVDEPLRELLAVQGGRGCSGRAGAAG